MANQTAEGSHGDFDPGPSFTDESMGATDVAELPSWLQTFAETVEDDAPAAAAGFSARPRSDARQVSAPPPAPSSEQGDLPFPGWLDSSTSSQSGAPGSLSETVGPSFFSEDDLPEWLRALSSEQPSVSSRTFATPTLPRQDDAAHTVEPAAPETSVPIYVPSVANVWVTRGDAGTDSPGASLFASIATASIDRPEATMVDAATGTGATTGAGARTTSASRPRVERPGRPAHGGWTRRERILVVLVIALSILMFIILNQNFGG